MSRKLRVGIAGLGRIFDLNSLGYVNHPEAEVAALCDSRPDLLKQRQPVFPQARTTTRYEEMLGWDLDLVDILTPFRCMREWRSPRLPPAPMSACRSPWR